MTQPAVGTKMIRAADKKTYEFWINEYQQRFWRCVDDPAVLIPYCVLEVPGGINTSDPVKSRLSAWTEGIRSSLYWDD